MTFFYYKKLEKCKAISDICKLDQQISRQIFENSKKTQYSNTCFKNFVKGI